MKFEISETKQRLDLICINVTKKDTTKCNANLLLEGLVAEVICSCAT